MKGKVLGCWLTIIHNFFRETIALKGETCEPLLLLCFGKEDDIVGTDQFPEHCGHLECVKFILAMLVYWWLDSTTQNFQIYSI